MKIPFPKIGFVKKILPRSLFMRSLLILTVPIVLTLSISTYVFFERHWERMAGRLATAVAGEIAFLVEYFEHDSSADSVQKLQSGAIRHMQMNLKFVEDGKIIPDPVQYGGRGGVIKDILTNELPQKLDKPYRILVDVEEKWIQVQVQLESGALIATLPERRLFSSSGYVFLIWMVGISTVFLIVATLFMRNQIRPIKRLAIAADKFGKGREVPFFKVEGAREVRQAARAFLGMRERIDKQIQQRTAMLAGVSHDLRTPLTRMKLQTEMMNSDDAKALKEDIEDMELMINAYLQFARGEGNEDVERVAIDEMVTRLVDNFARQDFRVNLETKGQNFSMMLRPIAFERCLTNILSNAQKYADQAWLRLEDCKENIQITIEDDGPGVAEDLYEEVFKPFYREEKSRNSKSGGVGLGLPIAQDIILAHGGDISLGKSEYGGLKVMVTLPY